MPRFQSSPDDTANNRVTTNKQSAAIIQWAIPAVPCGRARGLPTVPNEAVCVLAFIIGLPSVRVRRARQNGAANLARIEAQRSERCGDFTPARAAGADDKNDVVGKIGKGPRIIVRQDSARIEDDEIEALRRI